MLQVEILDLNGDTSGTLSKESDKIINRKINNLENAGYKVRDVDIIYTGSLAIKAMIKFEQNFN